MTYERLGHLFRCGHCQTELMPPAEPIEIENETAFASLISRSNLPILVDFWAPWCGPCKMVAPEVVKAAAQSAGRSVIAKVDTESVPSLAQRFQIHSIPTFVLFQAGREIARKSGALPAAAICQFIQKNEGVTA